MWPNKCHIHISKFIFNKIFQKNKRSTHEQCDERGDYGADATDGGAATDADGPQPGGEYLGGVHVQDVEAGGYGQLGRQAQSQLDSVVGFAFFVILVVFNKNKEFVKCG